MEHFQSHDLSSHHTRTTHTQGGTPQSTAAGVAAGVLLQAVLAAPFLFAAPWSYASRAFEFSRVFLHTWTVNLKFLPPDVFQSKALAVLLLGGHLTLLGLLASTKWFPSARDALASVHSWWRRASSPSKTPKILAPAYVLYTIFTGNFAGIVCARTLHFQFYSWYFHTLPLLLWCTPLPTTARLGLWAAVEVVWNVFPSRAWSSLLLVAAHGALLMGLLWGAAPASTSKKTPTKRN